MLHTEPPYNNYGTKILVARTEKIETRHLFSVERQRVALTNMTERQKSILTMSRFELDNFEKLSLT